MVVDWGQNLRCAFKHFSNIARSTVEQSKSSTFDLQFLLDLRKTDRDMDRKDQHDAITPYSSSVHRQLTLLKNVSLLDRPISIESKSNLPIVIRSDDEGSAMAVGQPAESDICFKQKASHSELPIFETQKSSSSELPSNSCEMNPNVFVVEALSNQINKELELQAALKVERSAAKKPVRDIDDEIQRLRKSYLTTRQSLIKKRECTIKDCAISVTPINEKVKESCARLRKLMTARKALDGSLKKPDTRHFKRNFDRRASKRRAQLESVLEISRPPTSKRPTRTIIQLEQANKSGPANRDQRVRAKSHFKRKDHGSSTTKMIPTSSPDEKHRKRHLRRSKHLLGQRSQKADEMTEFRISHSSNNYKKSSSPATTNNQWFQASILNERDHKLDDAHLREVSRRKIRRPPDKSNQQTDSVRY